MPNFIILSSKLLPLYKYQNKSLSVISNSSLQAMHLKLLSTPNKCKNTEIWVFQINAKIQKLRISIYPLAAILDYD